MYSFVIKTFQEVDYIPYCKRRWN